jgi:hypothetical protein
VTASMSVRFSGGPAVPTVPGEVPSPGVPIVAHLVGLLPALGVKILKEEDVEYAHELQCQVGARVYKVCVSYDWVEGGWWEVFWAPTLSFFQRLRGQSEEQDLSRLASAVCEALNSLPGIQERRWYPSYSASTRTGAPFTTVPVV